ncbi:TadE family type IV pilus minor pilin, partial [Streptomyces sp. NPDC000151]|uniref:TadE family type IV pilus minor pilin n=1 Tax=Streptomyces sp. NPDC000151 TaxID=3154244 RepID=UPI003319AF78
MSRSDPVGGATEPTAGSLKPTAVSLKAASDRGMVTAEAAVVIPTLVLFVAMLLWGLMAACAQIQCVDAARAGARAAARSEPAGTTLAAARA